MARGILPALVGALATGACASAGWIGRPGAERPEAVLDALAALGLDGEQTVRAALDERGRLTIVGARSHGDALTVDLRVDDEALLADLYRRLTGAPLPDGFSPDDFASMIHWALTNPEAFLASGNSMNELRRARRDAAGRSLEDPLSVAASERASGDAPRPAAGANDAAPSTHDAARAVPAPGVVAALGAWGFGLGRRRR